MVAATPVADATPEPANSTTRVAVAGFTDTTIEFYDFYVYVTAAAPMTGPVFFPQASGTTQMLSAFLTLGIALLARPLGSTLFDHFDDRIGHKSILAASLPLIGVSATLIGVLPGYDSIGYWAPLLLCVLRFGQGPGLGGEWGGAALLATESVPVSKCAWSDMFPQLGLSVGFLAANGPFLALATLFSEEQFRDWGWWTPFLLSTALVVAGLYIRLRLAETPVFAKAMVKHERVRLPIVKLSAQYWRSTLSGTLAMVVYYVLFYISAVLSLSYGVASLGSSREEFPGLLCLAVPFMVAATPLSAWLSDRFGRKPVLPLDSLATTASGFAMESLLSQSPTFSIALFLCIESFLMGVTFAPMGALLSEIFPTHVCYTGASATYNLGGIFGASVASYITQKLVDTGGLDWVGGYVSAATLLSLLAVLCLKETRDNGPGAVS